VTKQPPLITPDGTELSLDTSEWWLSGGAVHVQLLSEHWSIGGETNVWTNDDKGQYRYGWDAKLGLEWDKFAADDPRGNALAVAYIAGYQLEAYNLRNELGQTKARYPKHELQASGSIRRDKITYGLSLKVGGALLEPDVRHYVSAAPSMTWNLGDHVTLSFDAAITKRELPGPHPDELDNADYELISRASYAEPISLSGSLNLRVFWDRSNDALNDRLDDM
jgi:hypothetical protein